jgi:hypothetical protein
MDSASQGLSTDVLFIQIQMLGYYIIAIQFGVEWVVNRVFTTSNAKQCPTSICQKDGSRVTLITKKMW